MTDNTVKIDEIELPFLRANLLNSRVFIQENLSGIDLNITVYTDIETRQIEECSRRTQLQSMTPSPTGNTRLLWLGGLPVTKEGRPERGFHFEVKEVDQAKQFELLESEGHRFHVLKNVEDLHDEKIACTYCYAYHRMSSCNFAVY